MISESELSTRARKFAAPFSSSTNIETLMVDERLTTREARDELGHYQAQGRGKNFQPTVSQLRYFIESWYRNPVGVKP